VAVMAMVAVQAYPSGVRSFLVAIAARSRGGDLDGTKIQFQSLARIRD